MNTSANTKKITSVGKYGKSVFTTILIQTVNSDGSYCFEFRPGV